MTRTLLAIFAHPDDETFGAGGTLARYAADGTRVALICATRGEAGIAGLSPEEAGQVRERELRSAAATLGIAEIRLLGYGDGKLAQAEPEEVVGQLVSAIRDIRPQVVITFGPDGISGHPDHIAIHRLATQAFDRTGLSARLYYVMPSEATWQGCGVPPSPAQDGRPVVGVDVAAHLVAKVQAMQRHASQNPPYPGPPVEEATRLACHEYFALARPSIVANGLTDLFAALPRRPRSNLQASRHERRIRLTTLEGKTKGGQH